MDLAYVKAGDRDTASMGWAISDRSAPTPDEREIVVEDLPFRKNPLYFPNLGTWYSRREVEYTFARRFQNAAKAIQGSDDFCAWLRSLALVTLEDSLGACKFTNAKCTAAEAKTSGSLATVTATFAADPYRIVNGKEVL